MLIAASTALACQVPVFRYALERWPADRYEIVILHDGPLSDADEALARKLQDRQNQSAVPANLEVRTIQAGEINDDLLAALWKQNQQPEKPLLAVLYPRNAREVPDRVVQVTPLSEESIEHLVDSPVRQQIADKVIKGESAVWIFVPSGDPQQDARAKEMLTKQAMVNQQQLKLPPPEELESEEEFLEEVDIELRIGFSIVTLDRDDPKEQFLLQMLLASEPDLEELKQPMAFPVLGRGRVLYALVGKGINPETIGMASRFIVGPCSCQVKEQNPGFDLLLGFDWDEKISGSTISDPLPERSDKPVLLTIPPGKSKR
jgi:hypothetical protein